MFYSHDILARKGPLGTIWIAAHLDRKLRKNQVLDTDIGISVEAILSADLQKVLALRLSGHLLLGITRIFNRKVTYLYGDCENALLKLKQAYKPGNVDLPKDEAMAPYNAITLPDNFELPELDNLSERWATPLLTRKDKYTTSKANITLEDRVTHDPFDISQDEVLPAGEALDFDQPLNFDATPEVNRSAPTAGTGDDQFQDDYLPLDGGDFFDPMEMDVEKNRSAPTGEGAQEEPELFPAPDAPTPLEKEQDTEQLKEQEVPGLADLETQPTPAPGRDSLDVLLNGEAMLPTPVGGDFLTPATGGEPTVGKPSPKRRKLAKDRVIIDEATVISGHEMDRRIKNPGDLVQPRKRAAHTRRQIRLQVNAQVGVEALMRAPAVRGLGLELQEVVQRMLVKGKPEFVPLTEEAEERLATAKKQKVAEEEKAVEEEKAAEKEEEAPTKPKEAAEPTQENGTAPTPHEDFPPTGGEDFPPMDDHYDHIMPDGDWAGGDTAPYPPATPGDKISKGKEAAGLSGLEDLLTGKTPGGVEDEASEGGDDAGEDDTPTEGASGGVKGWSVRTRGVANRLQQVFQEKGGEESVPLDGLLEGYGRRTAAKMFFEVLVLKTSNYIDVKQEEAYGNVDLMPTPQLMAAAF